VIPSSVTITIDQCSARMTRDDKQLDPSEWLAFGTESFVEKVGEIIRWAFEEIERERDTLNDEVELHVEKIKKLEDELLDAKDKISALEGEIDDLNAPGQGPEDAHEISRQDNQPGLALVEKRFDGSFGCAWCGREIGECHERMEAGKCREMP